MTQSTKSDSIAAAAVPSVALRGYLGRGLLVLIAAAAVGLVISAGAGYHAYGDRRFHLLSALASALFLVFAQAWITLYLLGTGRLIDRTTAERGLDRTSALALRRRRTIALPWLAIGIVAVVALFLSGASAMIGGSTVRTHGWLFFAALAAQVAALVASRPALRETERQIRTLDRALAEAAGPAEGRA